MSPSAPGRYQSRLFNFIHQQSRRLRENLGSAFRHLQVATSWGVQIALHPLYLLLQSNKLVEKPLHSSVQQNGLHLQADKIDSQTQTSSSTADTPIQRVLVLVDALPVGEIVSQDTDRDIKLPFFRPLKWFTPPGPLHATGPVFSPSLLSRNRPIVRGIATQLSNHTLVLVTDQNQILDILTPHQQQKLQERIIGEVAEYWRYQRLAYQKESRSDPSLSGTETAEKFENRALSAELPRRMPIPCLQSWGSGLTPLDRTLVELESNYLAPMSEVAITLGKRSWEFVLVKTQLMALDGSKIHTFKIQALIWAAIDYFFGHRSGKQLGQTTAPIDYLELTAGSKPPKKPLPSRHSSLSEKEFSRQLPPQLLNSELDPWLTLSDLFGSESESDSTQYIPPPASQTTTHLPAQKNLLPSSKSTWYSLRNLLNPFQKFLPQPKPGSGEMVRQVEEICNQPLSQSTQLEPAPKWIETHASAMGYVKHPLEQLLEWLDRAMLWLEDFLVRVLQWIQQLWQGK